jgi:hypothetical protein
MDPPMQGKSRACHAPQTLRPGGNLSPNGLMANQGLATDRANLAFQFLKD